MLPDVTDPKPRKLAPPEVLARLREWVRYLKGSESHQALADRLGCDRSHVSRILSETRGRDLGLGFLVSLADEAHVSVYDLLYRAPPDQQVAEPPEGKHAAADLRGRGRAAR